MPRRWDEKYQFKYNKCISISRNDACSRSERPSSGLKKYKVNDHGIIICKYLESDEIDNLWPFLRLEMEWKKITIPIAIRQGFGTYYTKENKQVALYIPQKALFIFTRHLTFYLFFTVTFESSNYQHSTIAWIQDFSGQKAKMGFVTLWHV